ncbi:hypothetical protein E2C01_001035 [Portunus trituberculatus]|uniref:Uncharacterized protein n=1 Tax=Portunus trituberculatus TaxID=210409 RepID=A0A5B7CGU9_PORTR|nr:hypothetical protein [Portunus trituberculatus]
MVDGTGSRPLSPLSTRDNRLTKWSEHPHSYGTFLPRMCTGSPSGPLLRICRSKHGKKTDKRCHGDRKADT